MSFWPGDVTYRGYLTGQWFGYIFNCLLRFYWTSCLFISLPGVYFSSRWHFVAFCSCFYLSAGGRAHFLIGLSNANLMNLAPHWDVRVQARAHTEAGKQKYVYASYPHRLPYCHWQVAAKFQTDGRKWREWALGSEREIVHLFLGASLWILP